MAESLFSPYWYRAAQLHPRLVSSADVRRQVFRGEQWYVVTSATGGRQFRVNSLGYQIVGRLDGRQSVQEIWDSLVRQMGTEAPSQHEVLSILSELTAAGMIQSEYSPDLGSIFDAAERRRKTQNQLNPMALKVPLFDPTPLLDALEPLIHRLFKRWMLILWALCIGAGVVVAAMNWPELSNYASINSLTARNMLLMWLLYPIIKLIHELAHAAAIRFWQGEVREVGATLFLLVPVPYVDASAASGFPDKRHRMLVSAMGVIAETSIALIALGVWLSVSDGWVRNIAFACMLIGGLSTVLVNANPLMRYDGYYVLTDWLELPGLATRSDAWLRYLGERWLLGNASLPPPPGSANQRSWLFGYGVAALVYRLMLYAGMILWLLAKQVLLGVALALWMAWRYAARPIWQVTRLVWSDQRLSRHRMRAIAGFSVAAVALVTVVFILPMPYTTMAEGVVWVPDDAVVRNETEGFVEEVYVQDDAMVTAGQPLVRLGNHELESEREQLATRISSNATAFNAALMQQPGLALALQEAQEKLQQRMTELDEKLAHLVITSPVSGRLALPRSQDLPGRFLSRGSTLAHVVAPDKVVVRAVLPQADVAELRRPPKHIDVRMAEDRLQPLEAHVGGHGAPAASFQLPSVVLGDRAGGSIVTDPADQEGLRTLESFFVLDLDVVGAKLQRIGSRVWIRFEHAREPLAVQWSRRIRQLLVKQIGSGSTDLPTPLP
ncbi:PqqD family peptide modification chaperone [Uliginosibacterium sp. H3]|uniref:PqqD family peptide modification chaperone n=1 Tax=Uliginosibacterium silvisoli TaxID=3114758 RepID=A0ABU6K6L2_9RHOO|nr:PqqD family peptide modification chaperone [Uliginosibacterium sp. H3]